MLEVIINTYITVNFSPRPAKGRPSSRQRRSVAQGPALLFLLQAPGPALRTIRVAAFKGFAVYSSSFPFDSQGQITCIKDEPKVPCILITPKPSSTGADAGVTRPVMMSCWSLKKKKKVKGHICDMTYIIQ